LRGGALPGCLPQILNQKFIYKERLHLHMKCPYCGHEQDRVLDSRPLDGGDVIPRRRECQSCHKRFTTYERLEDVPLMVIKSDDRREPYNREKLREGLARACEKRPINADAIERLISEIEYELQDYVMQVPSRV